VSEPEHAADFEATWPTGDGRRILFLLDFASALEERVLREWMARHAPAAAAGHEGVAIPSSRAAKRRGLDPRLEIALASGDDPLLAPLRVAWRPSNRGGRRVATWRDLITFGDPRDPGPLRQSFVLSREPDRCVVVAGEPAPLSQLRERWQRAGGTDATHTLSLPEFVARQAALALERAERRLRGARYKVPRLLHEELLARPAFRGGIARLARELGRPESEVLSEATSNLAEIAASHSTYVIDLVARVIHYLYSLGYSALEYDQKQLDHVATLAQRHPIVFLPSHKSNLDHLVLQYMLHENGLPPNHTAGGINMNFFPVGPLVRRSGVFFIRRTFKDNPVYKLVLRQYIDYLIEKRFPLEWYIEGGRSRSGKLLPPRFGMLAYVVDAYRRGKSEDVHLVPVSIAYDQIQDVGDYVAEQRGAAKQRESFGWFLAVIRKLRRGYGSIHIRFGEPLSLAGALGPPQPHAEPNDDEDNLALQKLAFEVSVRINRATPITPTSLVTLALLGTLDRAVTVHETVAALRNLVEYVRLRRLPTTAELDLDTPEGVRRALDALVVNDVVTCFAEGAEPVYMIGEGQHLAAAYYRNTIIHFFVNGAIAELALLKAAETFTAAAASPENARQELWAEAMRLRDLLKFEFFFADKETFRTEVQEELHFQDPDWEQRFQDGAQLHTLLRRVRPFSAHRILRPFIEAYRVVGDALGQLAAEAAVDDAVFLPKCLALGKQYRLQRRIRSTESVSKVLLETALRLARNRNLTQPADDIVARRRAFADELADVSRRIDAIGALAASRLAGLVS